MTDKTRMVTRRLFLGGGVVGAGLALTGCNFEGGSSSTQDDEGGGGGGPTGTVRMSMGSVESLDPHYVNNAMLVVPAGLLEGLTFSNDEGTEPIPAAAESWEVSDDGLTYTFTMRSGATWSNGDPVTAADAEWSFKRLLTPTGAGSNYAAGASSYLNGLNIKGASEFLGAETDDWSTVGVTAPDDSTLEIELASPNSDFLLLLSHYSMVLVHPPSLEDGGQEWMQPENWVGNGAYVPDQWEPTTSLRMVANDAYWDYENVSVQTIELVIGMDETARMASFDTGDIDITGGSATTVDEREDLQELASRVDGYSLRYLQRMWGGHEASEDVRVRQALSMAIDREAIAAIKSTDEAGPSLIPGNVVPGWDESLAMAYDVDGARALMSDAGLDQVPNLRIQYNFEDPWLAVLADQWQEAFDTEVTIDILESGVHSDTRWQPYEDDSVISLYGGTFSGLPTMTNWVNNIFPPSYVMQFSMPTADWLEYQEIQVDDSLSDVDRAVALEEKLRGSADPKAVEFADRAAEAMGILDEDERTAAYIEAAMLREGLAFTIPISWSGRLMLVAEKVSGFHLRPSPEYAYYKYLTVDDS